jgi:preprotein translocase subunit SecE
MAEENKRTSRFGFISDVITELRKVTWPTPKETIYLTFIVLLLAAICGAVLGLFDMGLSKLVELIS